MWLVLTGLNYIRTKFWRVLSNDFYQNCHLEKTQQRPTESGIKDVKVSNQEPPFWNRSLLLFNSLTNCGNKGLQFHSVMPTDSLRESRIKELGSPNTADQICFSGAGQLHRSWGRQAPRSPALTPPCTWLAGSLSWSVALLGHFSVKVVKIVTPLLPIGSGYYHLLSTWQALEVGDGQWSLVCCSPWGCKELDTTKWLNWTAQVLGSLRHFM